MPHYNILVLLILHSESVVTYLSCPFGELCLELREEKRREGRENNFGLVFEKGKRKNSVI